MAPFSAPADIPLVENAPRALHSNDDAQIPEYHSDQLTTNTIKVEQTSRILDQSPSCLPSPSQSTSSSIDGLQHGDMAPSDSDMK
ncbi:hypothetical protein BGX24_004837, partial [Mortierella sp. AD032]